MASEGPLLAWVGLGGYDDDADDDGIWLLMAIDHQQSQGTNWDRADDDPHWRWLVTNVDQSCLRMTNSEQRQYIVALKAGVTRNDGADYDEVGDGYWLPPVSGHNIKDWYNCVTLQLHIHELVVNLIQSLETFPQDVVLTLRYSKSQCQNLVDNEHLPRLGGHQKVVIRVPG